jgi:hypothetical protein
MSAVSVLGESGSLVGRCTSLNEQTREARHYDAAKKRRVGLRSRLIVKPLG